MTSPDLVDRAPTAAEYLALRAAVGWHALDTRSAAEGLRGSLYAVCALADGRVVGCGRVVGDGGIYFYVQDLLVRPEHQRGGIGGRIMDRLMAHIDGVAPAGAFVGLMAAPGLEGFYGRYGFHRLPDDSPAMGIWR